MQNTDPDTSHPEPSSVLSGWQPISTAPKGKMFDVYSSGINIRWIDCLIEEGVGIVSARKDLDSYGRRRTTFHLVAFPTHWMPRPELPLSGRDMPTKTELREIVSGADYF